MEIRILQFRNGFLKLNSQDKSITFQRDQYYTIPDGDRYLNNFNFNFDFDFIPSAKAEEYEKYLAEAEIDASNLHSQIMDEWLGIHYFSLFGEDEKMDPLAQILSKIGVYYMYKTYDRDAIGINSINSNFYLLLDSENGNIPPFAFVEKFNFHLSYIEVPKKSMDTVLIQEIIDREISGIVNLIIGTLWEPRADKKVVIIPSQQTY